jgi:hypothetical protein
MNNLLAMCWVGSPVDEEPENLQFAAVQIAGPGQHDEGGEVVRRPWRRRSDAYRARCAAPHDRQIPFVG